MNNYPDNVNSNDPNAPWNDQDVEYKSIDATVSYTISKDVVLEVDDYIADYWEDVDVDEEGNSYCQCGYEYDYSKCDLKKAYKNTVTLEDLLDLLKEYVQEDYDKTDITHSRKSYLKSILTAIDGWNIDEHEIIFNNEID